MDDADELEKIADKMEAILSRFKRTRQGVWIAKGDEAKFTGLVLEARDLLAQSILGPANDFRFKVVFRARSTSPDRSHITRSSKPQAS